VTTKKKLLIALPILAVAAALVAVYVLATREKAEVDFARIVGPKPEIGAPDETLIPTVKVAKAVGWQAGEKPAAAAGLSVAAFAEGLEHPRWIYVLPNGDVLVSESNSPKRDAENGGDGLTGFVMNKLMARAGAGVPSPNRIILLRDADGDGKAELKTVLIAGLNSPSGMAWTDGQLYIANTDALVRVPFTPPTASRSTSPSDPPPTSASAAWTSSRSAPRSCRSSFPRAAIASSPMACAIPTAWRSNRPPATCGPWSTNAT
jgi:glucose/arabinose dehydrogenase